MKEIKFRAWDRLENRMVYLNNFGQIPYNWKEVWNLMQFTGLLDKNGKEIYEGDILAVTDPNGEPGLPFAVKWNSGACTYPFEEDFENFDITSIGWAEQMDYEFEVIGNIYENPDLIPVSGEG